MGKKDLYAVALAADEAYTKAISEVTGGKRNRWTATVADEQDPRIQAALAAKIKADDEWCAFLNLKGGR